MKPLQEKTATVNRRTRLEVSAVAGRGAFDFVPIAGAYDREPDQPPRGAVRRRRNRRHGSVLRFRFR